MVRGPRAPSESDRRGGDARVSRRTLGKWTLLGALAQSAPSSARGAARAASPARARIRLESGWRFHLGDAASAERDFGFGRDQRTFAKAGLAAPAATADFDDSAWAPIDVPHDWAVTLPFAAPDPALPKEAVDARAAHGYKAIGRDFPQNSIGWYRCPLPISKADRGRRIWAEFDGVFRDCRIFLNGYATGDNEGGYTPFTVDLTDFVDFDGPNVLTIRVDASLGEGWFYEGAGIYRHVDLVKADPVHVAPWGTFVRSEIEPAGARLLIDVTVRNDRTDAATALLRHTIHAPDGAVVMTVDGQEIVVAPETATETHVETGIAAPHLWSVETPNMYRLSTEILVAGKVVDQVDTPFGIRAIRFDAARGFLLNGQPIKLLGVCNHHDHAGVGVAIPDRLAEWRIERMKEMGANAWRSAHNPPSAALLDACDRLGMLMIDEARLNSTSPEALTELERMVRRDRNHPCVIAWSIGNEEPHQATPRGAAISGEMQRLVKRIDPTRPTTQAFDNGFGKGASLVVDITGFNYRTDQMPAFHQAHPDQPMMGTETASTVATRGAYVKDEAAHILPAYDTEHPWWATTAEEWWPIAADHPYVAGGFIWTGFDYRGEPTPFAWPSISSYFGVADLCGFPKDNFYYYRAQWRPDVPLVHLLPHWTWPGREGQDVAVWAHSNCDAVELSLNGKSLGRKPVPRHGHAEWRVAYAPGRIEAIGYRGGRIVARDRRDTAGAASALRLSADRMRLAADGRDLAMLTVEVVDAAGRVVPSGDNRIAFDVAASGRLIGVGNGDPTSHEPDQATTRSAFNGFAQGIVQSTRVAGPIRVAVTSEGLKGTALTLLALPGA